MSDALEELATRLNDKLAEAAHFASARDVHTYIRVDMTDAYPIAAALERLATLLAAARKAEAALAQIANDPHNSYEHTEGGTYGIGVTDGHRCAANKARAALAELRAALGDAK